MPGIRRVNNVALAFLRAEKFSLPKLLSVSGYLTLAVLLLKSCVFSHWTKLLKMQEKFKLPPKVKCLFFRLLKKVRKIYARGVFSNHFYKALVTQRYILIYIWTSECAHHCKNLPWAYLKLITTLYKIVQIELKQLTGAFFHSLHF